MSTVRIFTRALRLASIALGSLLLLTNAAQAVPAYARQTGLACIACHTEFPILNSFGREFKLNGYTLSSGQTNLPPIAFMLQPSFTQTNQNQPGGAAPHFGKNSNFALTQASAFYAGRLFGPYAEPLFGPNAAAFLNKIGVFSQMTYDGVARELSWDNAEIRYADNGTLAGIPVNFGIFANNNPTMEDLWNTTPAWGFPFSSSKLAPTPAASTLVEGSLAQQVVGLGAYVMLSHTVYLELAGYRTLSTGFQRAMGIATDGETEIPGVAPYWRAAYTKSVGNQYFEVGLFGLAANTYPGRVASAGKDHLRDVGVDAEYQVTFGRSDVTGLFSAIHESERWNASQKLGNTSNGSDHLWSVKATVDYLFDKTYGGAIGYFVLNGNPDPLLYPDSPSGSPLSDGIILQLNYMPLNKNGGPSFWPKSNLKLSAQYTIYNEFDGSNRHASDNNTLYLEAWIDF